MLYQDFIFALEDQEDQGMEEKILSLSATTEVADCLNRAYESGFIPHLMDDDFDPTQELQFWATPNGGLVATPLNGVPRGVLALTVALKWEPGAGYSVLPITRRSGDEFYGDTGHWIVVPTGDDAGGRWAGPFESREEAIEFCPVFGELVYTPAFPDEGKPDFTGGVY